MKRRGRGEVTPASRGVTTSPAPFSLIHPMQTGNHPLQGHTSPWPQELGLCSEQGSLLQLGTHSHTRCKPAAAASSRRWRGPGVKLLSLLSA